jgi:hypothetical protein
LWTVQTKSKLPAVLNVQVASQVVSGSDGTRVAGGPPPMLQATGAEPKSTSCGSSAFSDSNVTLAPGAMVAKSSFEAVDSHWSPPVA